MRIDMSLPKFCFVLELYKGWYCVEFDAIVFLAERLSAIDVHHFVGKSDTSKNGSDVFDVGRWQFTFEDGNSVQLSA